MLHQYSGRERQEIILGSLPLLLIFTLCWYADKKKIQTRRKVIEETTNSCIYIYLLTNKMVRHTYRGELNHSSESLGVM